MPPFVVFYYIWHYFNTIHQWFRSLHCYMSATVACYTIVRQLQFACDCYLLWCGYAGSSFQVKTETDSEDVMEYLLSLNTSQVRTSTWTCEAVCSQWMSNTFLYSKWIDTPSADTLRLETVLLLNYHCNTLQVKLGINDVYFVCFAHLCMTRVSVCYQFDVCSCIGVARGCSGCTCAPRAVKIFFRRNLQRKCVSAPPGHEVHPQPEQESIFRTVFAGWVRFGGIFRWSLRATTKKGSSTFLSRKSAPAQTKSCLRLCVVVFRLLFSHSLCLCTIWVEIFYQQVYFYFEVWWCFTSNHCNMWETLCSWLVADDDVMCVLTTSNVLISNNGVIPRSLCN